MAEKVRVVGHKNKFGVTKFSALKVDEIEIVFETEILSFKPFCCSMEMAYNLKNDQFVCECGHKC